MSDGHARLELAGVSRSFQSGEGRLDILKSVDFAINAGELVALASGRGPDESALTIHQDTALLGATLPAGQSVTHRLDPGRLAYLVPASGAIEIDGVAVGARDGATLSGFDEITISAQKDAEILLADLALA